jgi:conjugative transfer signal peptidase TraF
MNSIIITFVAVSVYVLSWLGGFSLAINPTDSIEPGVYIMRDRVRVDDLKTGDIVSACIPAGAMAEVFKARGYVPESARCPSGLSPVIKHLAAQAGDRVAVSNFGVSINGKYQANSKVFSTDSQGNPMGHLPMGWSRVLNEGEFFLIATRIDRSLDSRYYGLIRTMDLQGKAVAKLF